MDEKNIVLLVQLVRSFEENLGILERAYNDSNKSEFEESKNALMDLQKKIDFLIK